MKRFIYLFIILFIFCVAIFACSSEPETLPEDETPETPADFMESADSLLAKFKIIYPGAERVYAYFTGYGIISRTGESVEIDGETYMKINEPGLNSHLTLEILVRNYFNSKIAEFLLNKKVGEAPLFVDYIEDEDITLCQFGGYSGLWNIDVVTANIFEVIEFKDNSAVIRVSGSANEGGIIYTGSYDYKLELVNGKLIFTDFRLLVDVVWEEFGKG